MWDRGSEKLNKSSWLWISSCLGTKPCLVIISMDLLCNWDQKWTFFREHRYSYNHHVVICLFCLLSLPVNRWVPLLTGPGRLSRAYQISVRLWFKCEFVELGHGMVTAISCRHVMGSRNPILPQSFLSRCVESNIKQCGKQIVKMEPEHWEAFFPVWSENNGVSASVLELLGAREKVGENSMNSIMDGWFPFLCVKESREKVAGDMEHISLCLNICISQRGKYLQFCEI